MVISGNACKRIKDFVPGRKYVPARTKPIRMLFVIFRVTRGRIARTKIATKVRILESEKGTACRTRTGIGMFGMVTMIEGMPNIKVAARKASAKSKTPTRETSLRCGFRRCCVSLRNCKSQIFDYLLTGSCGVASKNTRGMISNNDVNTDTAETILKERDLGGLDVVTF